MLAIGPEAFDEFLAGGAAMDVHFFEAPFERNMPVLLALIGIWYNTFYGAHTHAIMPYDSRFCVACLRISSSWIWNPMASGSGVVANGWISTPGPVIWGEEGANSQHAFFQLLHQGTRLVPCDFIIPMNTHYPQDGQHKVLVANCLAQTEALMRGKTEAEVLKELAHLSGDELDMLLPQKLFPGNQPSNTLALGQADAAHYGYVVGVIRAQSFCAGCDLGCKFL